MITTNETDPQQEIAAAKAEAVERRPPPKLPRLGQVAFTSRTQEVELGDAGASLLLKKPSVSAILDMQDTTDLDSGNMREMYGATVGLITRMLVEPELTEPELRDLTDQLSFADWQHLQEQALELAGLGEETRQRTAGEFQRPAERT